ncbi:cytochrome b [Falsirhodobacter xinxiangensis]|uniref:cytochrome b n=1 Tax=Falsirhodobacter xinxiangensis TaxID=2530049 RepID=UPI001FE92E4A|nr:cytochrome b/b6 domain-containing protein [Rhodobacter xinxiangensis]
MAALPLRDSPDMYGRVTRLLHWTIAALMLWQFLGMALRLIFGRRDFVSFFVGGHALVGTVLFVLIVLRVVWMLANRKNRPDHGDGLLGLGARLGHLALYAVMATVPSVALLRAWGGDRGLSLLGVEVFAPKAVPVEWTQTLAGAVHGELAWVMLALIAGHVVMVGLHEGMWRDGTLARMVGRR